MRQLERHKIPFEFVFDCDANELRSSDLAHFGPSDLKRPHQSLVLKHLCAWQMACARNYHRILVFEDDVILARDFRRRFADAMAAANLLQDGWLVFLGGADTRVPDRFFLEQGLLVPQSIATAEGYVTDRIACQRRIAWCAVNKIVLPADHLIRHADMACGTAHYWLPEAIVEQGSVTGLFDTVLDNSRMKHSRIINIFRNRWNKFQRRKARKWWIQLRHRLSGLLNLS
jgi:glycosyl transferase family 25